MASKALGIREYWFLNDVVFGGDFFNLLTKGVRDD